MTQPNESPVLQPVTIGDLDLANRIVMAPLTRSRSDEDGVPPPYAADYYAQRAGAGLIISEATNISPQAVGYAFTPGIWSDAQVAAWKPVVQAVHDKGGKFFLQLWHTGRISHPDLHGGDRPVAPSAIKPDGQAFTKEGMKDFDDRCDLVGFERARLDEILHPFLGEGLAVGLDRGRCDGTIAAMQIGMRDAPGMPELEDFVEPRALETDEVAAIVEDYRIAARNAKEAGFDGVEVHSANNYLLEQFVRDTSNKRTDRYGGSIENRLRFPLDVVRAVVEIWGAGRVGIRISPATTQPGETAMDGTPMETYGAYIDALNDIGLLYIHEIEGVTRETRDVSGVDFAALRKRFDGAYIGNNMYDLDLAEERLAAGDADLFAFGRPFLANPDLVERLRTGAPLAEAPKEYWYGGDAVGYSDWPTMAGVPESVVEEGAAS